MNATTLKLVLYIGGTILAVIGLMLLPVEPFISLCLGSITLIIYTFIGWRNIKNAIWLGIFRSDENLTALMQEGSRE